MWKKIQTFSYYKFIVTINFYALSQFKCNKNQNYKLFPPCPTLSIS